MATDSIIKHLHILKYTDFRVFPSLIILKMHEFRFQRMKAALSDGIVVTATRTAHACYHAVLGEQFLKIIAGILTASI
jgi:hypothetical protein